jgi:putative hydrolase of the HAD superfamily
MTERVLLLDVDGVLVTPPETYWSRHFRTHPELVGAFFREAFMAASRGELDLLDVMAPHLEVLGYVGTPADLLAEWFAAEHHLNLPMLDAVRELRSRSWPVYLATNNERHRTRYLLEEMELGQLVDGEFASCSVGLRKPEAAYFAEVTRRLNRPAAQLVFWDDLQENVDAARLAGWTAHLFTDVSGFRTEMELVEG